MMDIYFFTESEELESYYQQIKSSEFELPTDSQIQHSCMRLGVPLLSKTVRKMRNATAAKEKISLDKINHEDDLQFMNRPARETKLSFGNQKESQSLSLLQY